MFRHSTSYTDGRETPVLFGNYEVERMLYDATPGMFPPSKSIAEATGCWRVFPHCISRAPLLPMDSAA